MSRSLEIRKAIASRIASLGSVERGKRQFNEGELPGLNVYMQPRNVDETSGSGLRYRMGAQVVVEYFKERTAGEIDDQADAMLTELRALIEIDPRQLGGAVIEPGISFASDEIVYPETDGGVLAVKVVYDTPHIDQFGA